MHSPIKIGVPELNDQDVDHTRARNDILWYYSNASSRPGSI